MVAVGDRAPGFALKDQNNQVVSLADFRGRRNVLLLFYPYAFTRVCEGELCAIRDSIEDFSGDDVVTLAVSVDSAAVHKKWADEQGYTFPLLADFWPHGAVAQAYGCFDEQRGCSRRGTYVIDRDGVVRWCVVNAIPDGRDHEEYRRVLEGL